MQYNYIKLYMYIWYVINIILVVFCIDQAPVFFAVFVIQWCV